MANMSKNGTTGKYELNITPSASVQTKTLKVGGTYCDADIDVKVSAMPSVSPAFTGGVPSLIDTSNTISVTGMEVSSSASAYYIDATASAKATRTNVTYDNNYTGCIDVASGTVASAAATSNADAINASRVYIKPASFGIKDTLPSGTSLFGTINRGNIMLITKGYNSQDRYLQAQGNSGTKSITTNGTHSCDGYSNVSVNVSLDKYNPFTASDKTWNTANKYYDFGENKLTIKGMITWATTSSGSAVRFQFYGTRYFICNTYAYAIGVGNSGGLVTTYNMTGGPTGNAGKIIKVVFTQGSPNKMYVYIRSASSSNWTTVIDTQNYNPPCFGAYGIGDNYYGVLLEIYPPE